MNEQRPITLSSDIVGDNYSVCDSYIGHCLHYSVKGYFRVICLNAILCIFFICILNVGCIVATSL